ncbi:hypothetical protein [Streptomyces sp. 7N604]|uniref:hypothetical protein n=1 Tax=Streptomyces sp. 7N604 TaxID=3457415 RepID=UPI003FCF4C77
MHPAARVAHRLAVHRGHSTTAGTSPGRRIPFPHEIRAANDTSNASRSDVTLALYELRVLTRDTELLRLPDAAVAAAYAANCAARQTTPSSRRPLPSEPRVFTP